MPSPKRMIKSLVKTPPQPRVRFAEGEPRPDSYDQFRIYDAEMHDDTHRSVLFFTTHKCASIFLGDIMRTASQLSSMRHLNYAAAIYRMKDTIDTRGYDHTEIEHLIARNADRLFRPRGEIYGPLRRGVDFPERRDYTQIFFLRDPRDVLVSAYFSFGGSHGTPHSTEMARLFQDERTRMQEEGIDRYALRAARDWIGPVFEEYAAFKRDSEHSHYFSYDLYKNDPATFLKSVLSAMGLDLDVETTPELQAFLARAVNATAQRAPQTKKTHRRSGQSKQFLTELKPDTVTELNDILGPVLEFWNFEI
ncbi:sulfotransferase domain-containing protein [Tropicimonas sp. S265A]|uniref:sulfotransferase domain-containing protein n=1 Tax=Tropicimonas sp. S265A TaxID=3415134 RepID=UPI003C7AF8B9